MPDKQKLTLKPVFWMSGLLLLIVFAGVVSLALSSSTVAAQVVFATNTPPAPDPLRHTPDAPMSQYALRLWSEADLVDVLISQLNHLAEGEAEQQIAVALTLNELSIRFPGAPHDSNQRDRLLDALFAAPRGSVDIRVALHPFIVEILNANLDMISTHTENTVTIENLSLRIIPVNFDAVDPVDVVLHVRYPADAAADNELLYEYFVPLVRAGSQAFTLPDMAVNLPAAPYKNVKHVRLLRVEDLNNALGVEMAIGIDTGNANEEMLIVGWRGGQIINLIAADQPLLYGELPEWDVMQGNVTTTVYQVESERWNCLSSRKQTWEWNANYYRPAMDPISSFRISDSLGCAIYAEEPIFEKSAAEAIVLLHELLEGADETELGYDRGKMALAMLYYLAGQDEGAAAQIGSISGMAVGNQWLTGQLEAFSMATASGLFDPFGVCAALVQENPAGACDLDQVILQRINQIQVRRDTSVSQQLIEIGLPVLETTTVSQIGRADRVMVSFNLPGSRWFAFAPLDQTYYTPEIADAPFDVIVNAVSTGMIEPTTAMVDTLIIHADPLGVMNTLDNLTRQNPGLPLSPASRYLLAHTYDLMGDRQAAREAYYVLWAAYPNDTWGQLAGAHLERR